MPYTILHIVSWSNVIIWSAAIPALCATFAAYEVGLLPSLAGAQRFTI
jgi:hypothetical protein